LGCLNLPDVYTDWRVVFGVALLVLGIGNWVVGWEKVQQYAQIAATESKTDSRGEESYHSFDELGSDPDGALAPLTAEQREVSFARARMDFYHATFMTGRFLVSFGLVFSCIGFLSLIRKDTRRAVTRLNLRVKAEEPFSR
jgi:multisubunit Na+/H+ antiporter MnhG subunit